MIPILYPLDTTTFYGNGLGPLAGAKYCRCTEVLNGSYELELQISKDAPHALDIYCDCVIKVKPNHYDDPQPFRIYSVERDGDGYVTAKASHISYDTSGIPILPFTSEKLSDAVESLNTNRKVLKDSEFIVTSDYDVEGTIEVKQPESLRSLLFGSDNTLASIYKGELHFDNYTIEILEHRGINRGICFRWGVNIVDFEQETSHEELYSAVLGFWKKEGTEDEPDTIIYGDIINVANVLPYDKIYILDVSEDIKNESEGNDDPPDPTVDQINECVEKYIESSAIGIPEYSMKIDYIEDKNSDRVCIGDSVGVVYPPYNIKAQARCTKVVFDCLLERNVSVQLGVSEMNISELVATLANTVKQR